MACISYQRRSPEASGPPSQSLSQAEASSTPPPPASPAGRRPRVSAAWPLLAAVSAVLLPLLYIHAYILTYCASHARPPPTVHKSHAPWP